MERLLRILMVEDMAIDAELEIRELKRAGMRVMHQVVETEPMFRDALREFQPDLILSDFSMPHFDGMWALEIARELAPDVPFIFVSGTIGEEYAIRALRNGATDYVLKNNLVRLPAAVERALQDGVERAARRKAERDLEDTRSRLDSIVSSLSDVIWSVSLSPYQMQFVSRAFESVWGMPLAKLYQNPDLWIDAVHADDRAEVQSAWHKAYFTWRWCGAVDT
jgi:CheY-like chemotaxis protein